jgi:hypothetical protein
MGKKKRQSYNLLEAFCQGLCCSPSVSDLILDGGVRPRFGHVLFLVNLKEGFEVTVRFKKENDKQDLAQIGHTMTLLVFRRVSAFAT